MLQFLMTKAGAYCMRIMITVFLSIFLVKRKACCPDFQV